MPPYGIVLNIFPVNFRCMGRTLQCHLLLLETCVPLVARIEPHPSCFRDKIAVELLS